MKQALLKAAILEILADKANPATEQYVMLALSVTYSIKVTFSDMRSALNKLEEDKQIAGITEDEIVYWDICPKGRLKRASR